MQQLEEKLSLRASFVARALAVLTRKQPSIRIVIFSLRVPHINSAGAGLAPHAGGHSLLKRKVFQFGFTARIILLFILV